jgi:hypothetical protein
MGYPMSERKMELIETLEALIEAQETMDASGIGVVRFETKFLREVLNELKDKIDIYGASGDLVCTIEGPSASFIIDMAVREFIHTVIARFAEDATTP